MQTLDQQLEQMEALALRRYPDEEAARKDFVIRMLTERLRAFVDKFQSLPVKQMSGAYGVQASGGTFACPVCATTTPHHHTDDEVQAARLMAMPESEVDAELRRLGIDPDEAVRQGKAAVEGALEAIRTHGVGVHGEGQQS